MCQDSWVTASDRRRTGTTTRAALLDATRQLLGEGASISSLGVDKIVIRAGLSRATFYLHFTDKTQLIAGLAEDLFSWRDYIGAEVLADPNLERQTLDAMLALIVSRWRENKTVLAAIIEMAEYDESIASAWRSSMMSLAETAAEQMRLRWLATPDSTGDPDTIAEIFTWMFERSCHQILRDETREQDVASSLAEIIWRVITYPA